ncbi:hypothetical protein [Ancylobacter pratisalsi]|uniref:MxaH protein n=1 Tax=Ancylobacter pratisalsi TaxID=1745854 RepID=A0A6P1YQN3_9HYPH|nr:hypothetical protein [Ancylobacter pratisalsi]QIB35758.1 hypothetical protein G3A50_20125 [Ancylobacter pratisalsi]
MKLAPPIVRHLSLVTTALVLAGCPDAGEPERGERVTEAAGDALVRKSWLQPTDATPPARWLASREAGADLAADAPAVAGWRELLDDADQRFGETDRMIANRAAQLEAMLAEINVRETARQLLTDFASLAAKGSRSGFSDICQHYFNLRSQGMSRRDALAALHAEPTHRGDAE